MATTSTYELSRAAELEAAWTLWLGVEQSPNYHLLTAGDFTRGKTRFLERHLVKAAAVDRAKSIKRIRAEQRSARRKSKRSRSHGELNDATSTLRDGD